MFGWEFPPYNSGGLGVACKGLAQALVEQKVRVVLVLPKKMPYPSCALKIIFADESDGLAVKAVNSLLTAYATSASYDYLAARAARNFYGSSLFEEVMRYAHQAAKIVLAEEFDLIHSHDWLSFPAGLAAQKISGKPMIVHIHATEFDRTGGNNPNQRVYEIEKEGMEKAQAIIAVSNFTKNKIIQHYGIEPRKINVVYNAVARDEFPLGDEIENLALLKKQGKRFVLFVGRITLQKGPDYFLRAAKRVLEINPNVRFIMVGSGDLERQCLEEAAWLGISDKVFFTGFLERGQELAKLYKLADLYVLPSVSEPFGITVLEALSQGIPVLISKQAGVGEMLSHCLKVDFWDIDEMANKILAVLGHCSLRETLQENGSQELQKFSWEKSARKCLDIYQAVLKEANPFV